MVAMSAQFEMFQGGLSEKPLRADRSRPSVKPDPSAIDEAAMVAHLTATGRYRILTKLVPRAIAANARTEFPLRGVILDTETTGLDPRKCEIIEIGAIAFSFDALGRIGEILAVYGGLQQPRQPIPAEITRLTGIDDAMVENQVIDVAGLRALIDPADLVIAHNAAFDRPFCEKFAPFFHGKAWACSHAEVDWAARGFEGTKLGYLLGQSGYFHEGHRAVDDCFALLEVLVRACTAPDDTAFAELYGASQKVRVRIFAENSPFDLKDHLKARGYRWSDGSEGRPKSWWIEVDEQQLEGELAYLRSEIYRYPEADPPLKYLTAFDRFRV